MKEYSFVETIKKRAKTDIGMQGVLEYDVATKILADKAKEGWRIHTFFPDDRGTCLLEREIGNDKVNVLLEELINQNKSIKTEQKEQLESIDLRINRILNAILTPFWKRKQPDGEKQPLG